VRNRVATTVFLKCTRILLRADSGFACEAADGANKVAYLFGLARNERLVAGLETTMARAARQSQLAGKPLRRF